MHKYFLLIVVILFFGACSSKHIDVVQPNEKAFEQEDTYILFALRAEEVHNNKTAAKLFDVLYQKSHKKEYLYRMLENLLVAKEYDKVISVVDSITQGSLDDAKLIRLKIIALFEKNELQKAKELALQLAHSTQEANDYILVGDIYSKQGQYDLALKYLEGAYVKEYNEKILDKIAIILYVNLKREKDAIAQLESHTRIHGCSELICNRLVGIYSNENDIDGLLSVYKRMYALKKDDATAKKIIQIYSYKRDYVKLMDFLEENHIDDELLLQLYVSAKNYTKAYKLANKLYEKNNDIALLGQSALYEYEAKKEHLSKETLQSIIQKLERVVQKTDDTLFLNYLGYILIDHEIDIPKGMKYIKKVVKIQPNSAYYLDSLAWGYYKLHQCKKAKTIIDKVVTLEGGDDPEVLYHQKEINDCIDNPQHKKVIIKR